MALLDKAPKNLNASASADVGRVRSDLNVSRIAEKDNTFRIGMTSDKPNSWTEIYATPAPAAKKPGG